MKAIFKLVPAALALVALASCSNDDFFGSKNSQLAVDGKTMTAAIEDNAPVTRAAFAENKNDAGAVDARALVWTAGDSYKVYGELATADKYTLQNSSAGKRNGTFDLMTEDYNTEPAFAVFPYDKIEADRASKKLTVNMSDWTYKTCDVAEDGYNQGGFVSDVPMFGEMDEAGEATFYYMTALLRVDLTNIPKKTTRMIIVTDRPLTGNFDAELPDDGSLPEVKSPVSNDATKANYQFVAADPVLDYTNAANYPNGVYGLEISTESVAKRTNKTFFVAVPTGNKYKVFDVILEYNMGTSKKYEIVAQLGNTYRLGAGKSILKWERGKVKTMSKEITVTAGGNTPEALAAFLKAEWKNFPGDEINIVPTLPGTDTPSSIDLSGTAANRTFEVPAEVQGKIINIVVDKSMDLFNTPGATMIIQDEDQAPVASEALRLINLKGQSTANVVLDLQCPETQITLEAWGAAAGETATYGAPAATLLVSEGDMAHDAPGFLVNENVTLGNVTVTGGSFISVGTVGAVINNDNYDMKIGGTAASIANNGTGALDVLGAAVAANVTGNIVNGNGTKKAGKLTIKKVNLGGTVTNAANADNGIEIKGVDNLTLTDNGKGAVSIEDVTTLFNTSTINAASSLTMKNIASAATITYKGAGNVELDGVPTTGAGGVAKLDITNVNAGTLTVKNVLKGGLNDVQYNGKKAVVIDNIVGGSATGFNIKNTGNAADFTFTNIKGGVIADVTYAGTGNVTGTGVNNGGYPTITTMTTGQATKAGDVALTDLTIGTSLVKNSVGTLTINGVRANFGTITNAKGAINITGNAPAANRTIASLTQNGAGNVTLKAINALTALNMNETSDVDYENTVITTLTVGGGKTVKGKGTKASGIVNYVTGTNATTWTRFLPETDVWDGSSYCPVASDNIYTSASFAKLKDAAGAVDQWLEIDMNNKTFAGIKNTATSYNGHNFAVKNLKVAAGMFATPTAALTVSALTLDAPTVTAKAKAGAIVGKLTGNLTLVGVTVKDGNIGTTATGAGTDQGLGGMIGEVDNAAAVITVNNGYVKGTTISGHYYMGGIIGKVTNASQIYLYGKAANVKNDLVGTVTTDLTFVPKTLDGSWSTLLSGTIAPFIGGILNLGNNLQIYGTCDEVTKDLMEAWYWDKNFLTANETIKFKGCKRNDLNFIGYTAESSPLFTYDLKLVSGFEANPSMTRRNTSATTTVLDTEYNCYMAY